MPRRRIWSETLPYATLCEARTLSLLRRFRLGVLVSVRPRSLADLPRTLEVLSGEGIETGVWPMLEDEDGRWANARNASRFTAFARNVVDALGEQGVTEVVVDLEPPIFDVRAAMTSARGAGKLLDAALDEEGLVAARGTYASLVRELGERGVRASAVAVPVVLFDRSASWEALLGTPLDGPPWSSVSVMLYTSILEGWSKGLLGRSDAVSVLAAACRATRSRFGDGGGVSLGAVGTGAFGDEPVYRSPAELARDVAVARASGVENLTLFELGGVLGRAPAEVWLEAFVDTPAASVLPPGTLRGRAVSSMASLAGASLGVLAPLLRRAIF